MQDVQMGSVYGIFHDLKPVAIQGRQSANPPPAVGSRPDVVFRNHWSRRQPKIAPVKADEFLHRIGLMLHGKREIAPSRFCRSLETVAFRIIEPAMISAGDAALFDCAVGK